VRRSEEEVNFDKMPKYALQMKSELKNVLEFRIDTEKVDWTVDLERGSDGMRKTDQTLNKQDVFEIEGSKGDANYIMKWEKGDKSACNISIIEDKTVDATYGEADSNNWKTMCVMEARGADIIAWKLADTSCFQVISGCEANTANRKKFNKETGNPIDFLADGESGKFEFYAVDEEGEEVAMKEVEVRVTKA